MTSINKKMVRIAEIEVDPHCLDDYKAMLTEEIESSIKLEAGVIFLHAVSLQDDPCKIRVFECYANREAYETHITSPHFLKYKSGTLKMVKALKLIETTEIALASKLLSEG